MDDLISRQAALDMIHGTFSKSLARQRAEECIKKVPSARVEPKKGEWEETEVIANAYGISGVKTWASKMMCDQCGFTTFAIEGHFSQYNFCPNCGACMKGEQDE